MQLWFYRNKNTVISVYVTDVSSYIMRFFAGHVADTLQVTDPDVFISSDGGYSWAKVIMTYFTNFCSLSGKGSVNRPD